MYRFAMGCAVFFLLLGIAFPLLLNGQVFTNSILGIACCLAAAGLALKIPKDARVTWGRRSVFYLAVVVGLYLLLGLPNDYEFQNRFNARMDAIRQERERARE